MKEILKTENLTKKYKKNTALDSVDFTLMQGEIYGLIGRNGAGKSTFLGIITGAVRLGSGILEIQGMKGRRNVIRARRNIGFMLEPNFYAYLTAEENLKYICKVRGISDVDSEIKRVLELLGLYGNKKNIKSYSMGMKQRLGIAAALLGNPDIVILDEPINGLDPQGIMDFRNIVTDIHKAQGTTFIISSHILAELGIMATKFGFLEKGRLIKEMTDKELAAACENQLIVKTDNQEKAVVILEDKLNIKNYKVNGNNEIVLSDYIDNPQTVSDTLYENGLHILTIKSQSITLEEFFFNLIGGGNKYV